MEKQVRSISVFWYANQYGLIWSSALSANLNWKERRAKYKLWLVYTAPVKMQLNMTFLTSFFWGGVEVGGWGVGGMKWVKSWFMHTNLASARSRSNVLVFLLFFLFLNSSGRLLLMIFQSFWMQAEVIFCTRQNCGKLMINWRKVHCFT